jgi:hypothetical protein
MTRHMGKRTTLRLPQDLLKRARCKAAAEGRTLTALIEDGLRLVEDRGAGKRKRVLPRVSTARGGLMAGLDLGDVSALQESEDLRYIALMKRCKS